MTTWFLHFFLFLITILSLVSNLIPAVHSHCIEDQQLSLLHFKNSFVFDSSHSSKLITWNSSTDCCSWRGVTCSTNGHVVGLDLSSESISCRIDNSRSLFQLQHLQSLNLANNTFNGPQIPSAIGNLTKLVNLDLSRNKFNGPISAIHWESLVNLESLDLSNNLLNGSIPSSIVSSPLLEKLSLSYNQFSGQVPEFSNTSSYLLQTLDLGNNNLEGQIPASIFNLKGLLYLDLSSNNFSGFPFNGPQQPRNLSSLNLSHNSLFDYNGTDSSFRFKTLLLASNKLRAFPDFLKNQSTLSKLDLSGNQIQGQIPNWVWSLRSLLNINLSCNSLESLEAPLLNSTNIVSVIDLHSNQLQGQIPMFIRGTYLDYSRNNFSSSIPTDIGDFIYGQTYLSLSSNNLHGAIPKSICNATGMVLDLSNNSLSGFIPQCLTGLRSLSVLDLSRNNLTGTIPDNFHEQQWLQTLDLSRNHIQGQLPKSLVNCSMLRVLNLENNQIIDTFPCMMMSIYNLHVLVLRFNKFYGSIGCPITNDTWPVLQIIDIAHNNLSGEIPGRMSLTWQAMVANEDDSPTNIGFGVVFPNDMVENGLVNLYYRNAITAIIKGLELHYEKILSIFTLIDFSFNNFNGSIPEEMGQLKSLYILNLSGNALTGEIPSSFGNMQTLESLDLSQNHLSGQIPPQLATLTFLSFLNLSSNQLTGRIPTGTQFSTFPNTSFEGNKGLWGPPLTADTVAARPPPKSNGSLSNPNSRDEIDWDIIIVEIGFTCGFGIAVGSLLFCKRWRKWYYKAICSMLFKIFPQLEQRFGNHTRHVYVNTRWRH